MHDFGRIRGKLERLRLADPGLNTFGAIGHRYRFRPPLEERELLEFERRQEIRLPEGYRAFLRELGNGGPGPFYGIHPLGLFDGGRDDQPWEADPMAAGRLDRPFPLREAWNLPAERLTPPAGLGRGEALDRWFEAFDEEYWRPDRLNGAFPICHHGCALRTYLVVTGPERGNVWFDRRADYEGMEPHVDHEGRHLEFLEWYVRWLDESLASLGVRDGAGVK